MEYEDIELGVYYTFNEKEMRYSITPEMYKYFDNKPHRVLCKEFNRFNENEVHLQLDCTCTTLFVFNLECIHPAEAHQTFKKGDRVLVRDYDNEQWKERIYVTTIPDKNVLYPYICVEGTNEEDFLNGKPFSHSSWEQIKAIESPKKTVLTMQEIADKFNVDVKELRIKE